MKRKTSAIIRALLLILSFSTSVTLMAQSKDFNIVGIWKLQKIYVSDTIFADFTNSDGYEQFKYYDKDGMYYNCNIYLRSRNTPFFVPTQMASYVLSKGKYTENGHRLTFDIIDDNTFSVRWNKETQIWVRPTDMKQEYTDRLINDTKAKYLPQIQEIDAIKTGKVQAVTGAFHLTDMTDDEGHHATLQNEILKVANPNFSFQVTLNRHEDKSFSLEFERVSPLVVTGEIPNPNNHHQQVFNVTDEKLNVKWFCSSNECRGLVGNRWLTETWTRGTSSPEAEACLQLVTQHVPTSADHNIFGYWADLASDPETPIYYIITPSYIATLTINAVITRHLDIQAELKGAMSVSELISVSNEKIVPKSGSPIDISWENELHARFKIGKNEKLMRKIDVHKDFREMFH